MRLPSYQALSKEQDRINNLPLDGRHLVTGPPGTGKTVMALYRAAMLKKLKRKARLLMYSRLLSQYTESAVGALNLDGTVDTFHSWFYGWFWREYHRSMPEIAPFRPNWPEVVEIVASAPPEEGSVPDLIVDEGQDLAKMFYTLAQHMADHITVFADENQRINQDNSTIKEIQLYAGLPDPHLLTKNYRNTLEIAQLAAAFYNGLSTGIPELPTRRGTLPVVQGFANRPAAIDFIRRFAMNNGHLEIGVFTPSRSVQNSFYYGLRESVDMPVQRFVGGKGKAADLMMFDDPAVTIVNYPSAKGLEFDAVFIPELQDYDPDQGGTDFSMQMYVLISRARDQLFLAYSGKDKPAIIDILPKELVEWR